MAFEARDLSGTLFKNDRKEKDTHPDYRGKCLIEGVEYYISSWIKDGRNGKFMSLAFTAVDGTRGGNQQKPQTRAAGNYRDNKGSSQEIDESSIPF